MTTCPRGVLPNKRLQRTALRAAAEPERWAATTCRGVQMALLPLNLRFQTFMGGFTYGFYRPTQAWL
jgi:hypothetical protein